MEISVELMALTGFALLALANMVFFFVIKKQGLKNRTYKFNLYAYYLNTVMTGLLAYPILSLSHKIFIDSNGMSKSLSIFVLLAITSTIVTPLCNSTVCPNCRRIIYGTFLKKPKNCTNCGYEMKSTT